MKSRYSIGLLFAAGVACSPVTAMAETGAYDEAAKVESDAIVRARQQGASPALVTLLKEHRERFLAGESITDPAS